MSLILPWYWISMHFYIAQPPVSPFTMVALLAAGDPLPCLFALAGLLPSPKTKQFRFFQLLPPHTSTFLHWKWHGTHHTIETIIAKTLSKATHANFHCDPKLLMPLMTSLPSKLSMQPTMQPHFFIGPHQIAVITNDNLPDQF